MMESSGSSFVIPADTDPVIGGVRTFGGLKVWERLFLLVSFVNILATITLTTIRLVIIITVDKNTDTPDLTFAIVLLINCLFCSFYVIHGVLRELTYEVYVFIAAVLAVTFYCVIEYAYHVNGRNHIKLARMISGVILAPVNITLALLAARDFGFLAFRIVGASELLQRMYNQTQIFTCFLKFDVQVAVSFIVLLLHNGARISTMEMIVLIVGVPYTVLLAALGWTAMVKEMRTLLYTFDLFCLLGPAFVLFKVVQVYQYVDDHPIDMLDYSILAAGALALLIRFIIVVESIIVLRNFNYGLKETAFSNNTDDAHSLLYGIRVGRDGSILQTEDPPT